MNDEYKLSYEEKRVYRVIMNETMASGGISQRALKSHPDLKDLESKRITQIIKKLIELNMIKRSVVENNGKRTYILSITNNKTLDKDTSPHNNSSVNNSSFLEIPCIKCRYLFSCSIGHPYDPLRCSILTQFILEKAGIITNKPINRLV
ncbi:MAG: hypothetical protein QXG46_00820 [Ignisphaera sp.]|uniref:B-block binding subunit of TFIIIC domain-containing protein n=1 Tax=Ignisphaera aggregans TaxID=334771 RepID=A0A7C4H409_9CREN